MSRKKKGVDGEAGQESPAIPSPFLPDGKLDDRTPVNMAELAGGVSVNFEWLEGGAWQSRLINGRIVPDHPEREASHRPEHTGVRIYHAVDHIEFELNGCVRCVPFSHVTYWGWDAPKETAANV